MNQSKPTKPTLNVVAGIVENEAGEFLLSSRPQGKPYAGYWEFAGGKIEANETKLDALKREFQEELNIQIHNATIWLTKTYDYEHALVHLHFYRVAWGDWSGEPKALENQSFCWQKAGNYTVEPMLPANSQLLKALSIPRMGFKGEFGFSGSLKTFETTQKPTKNHFLTQLNQLNQLNPNPQNSPTWHYQTIHSARELEWVCSLSEPLDFVFWEISNEMQFIELIERLGMKSGVSIPIVAVLNVRGLDWANSDKLDNLAITSEKLGLHSIVLAE